VPFTPGAIFFPSTFTVHLVQKIADAVAAIMAFTYATAIAYADSARSFYRTLKGGAERSNASQPFGGVTNG